LLLFGGWFALLNFSQDALGYQGLVNFSNLGWFEFLGVVQSKFKSALLDVDSQASCDGVKASIITMGE